MAKLKIYCSTCGKPAEYDLSKPMFCFACGHSYSGGIKASVEIAPPEKEIINKEDSFITNINKLEIDVTFYNPAQENIEDLARYPGESTKRVRNSVPKINSKEAMAEFKREAGTLRKKNGS